MRDQGARRLTDFSPCPRSQTGNFANVIQEEIEAFEHVEGEVTSAAKKGIEYKIARREGRLGYPPPPPKEEIRADAALVKGRRLRMLEQR